MNWITGKAQSLEGKSHGIEGNSYCNRLEKIRQIVLLSHPPLACLVWTLTFGTLVRKRRAIKKTAFQLTSFKVRLS